jgi:hypothetical protein
VSFRQRRADDTDLASAIVVWIEHTRNRCRRQHALGRLSNSASLLTFHREVLEMEPGEASASGPERPAVAGSPEAG